MSPFFLPRNEVSHTPCYSNNSGCWDLHFAQATVAAFTECHIPRRKPSVPIWKYPCGLRRPWALPIQVSALWSMAIDFSCRACQIHKSQPAASFWQCKTSTLLVTLGTSSSKARERDGFYRRVPSGKGVVTWASDSRRSSRASRWAMARISAMRCSCSLRSRFTCTAPQQTVVILRR